VLLFFITFAHRYTLASYFRTWGRRLLPRIGFVFYEDLERADTLPAASAYVFTDLERLTPGQLELARDVAASVEPARILNDPRRALRRFELLRELHARGVNPYQVYRAEEADEARLPAFLRVENEHEGPLTGLLRTELSVRRAVAKALREGADPDRLMVVEHVDVAERGCFTRYAAYLAGGRPIPARIAFGRRWVTNYSGQNTPEQLEQQRRHLAENPHADEIAKVGRIARAEFGRVDYAVRDGRVCVWELNTNPSLLVDPKPYELLDWTERIAERLNESFERLL
jgi:hypothetical protein